MTARLCLAAAVLLFARATGAQSTAQVATTSGFVPGGEELFALDFASAKIGSFPGTIRRLSGTFDVVSRDGVPMLRASENSEFLITLSRSLPQNFTIEVDLVPKECCPPPDLTLEGTATVNQGAASAHLLWTADASFGWVGVIGGAVDNREFQMPDELRVTLPGSLAKVGVSVEGGTITLYTNGRQLYSVQAHFARGSVLRVTLGGQKDGEESKPVYLARVRVATGAPTLVATMVPATTGGTITPIVTSQQATAPASSGAITTGPVSTTNPTGAGSLAPYAAPSHRSIPLDGFTASGIRMDPRTITLAGYAGLGVHSAVSARSISVPGFVSAGSFAVATSRKIAVSGFSAAGTATLVSGPAPRTIGLTEFTGSSFFTASVPRTIALTAFTAAGLWSEVASRRIPVPAVVAAGGGPIAPRTIKLAGWTASGSATPPLEVHMSTRIAATMLVITAISTPNVLSAQTMITFEAPVKLTQLSPDLQKVSMYCEIKSDAIVAPNPGALQGADEVAVVAGQLVTTFRVVLTFPEGTLKAPVGKTANYTCDLRGRTATGLSAFADLSTNPGLNPAFVLKPVPPIVQGSFVW